VVGKLENSEIVVLVRVHLDVEHAGMVRLAPDFEVHPASCEHHFGFGRDSGGFAEILGDQQLALVIHARHAAEHRELAEFGRLLGRSQIAVLHGLHPVVESLLAEHLDHRHVMRLGEQQKQNLAGRWAPRGRDGNPKLRVHLVGRVTHVALFGGVHWKGLTDVSVPENTLRYTQTTRII